MKRSLCSTLAASITLLLLTATQASALQAGQVLPWDTILAVIVKSLSGPTAHAFLLIEVIATGIAFMTTDHGGLSMRLILRLAIGGALMVLAADFLTATGLGGAVV